MLGKESTPVQFTNLKPGTQWPGLEVLSQHGNLIEHAILDSSENGLTIGRKDTVRYSRFIANKKQGWLISDTISGASVENTFQGNGFPMNVDASFLQFIPAQQNFMDTTPILIHNGLFDQVSISGRVSWPVFTVPYYVRDSIVVQGPLASGTFLEIQPGTKFLMAKHSYFRPKRYQEAVFHFLGNYEKPIHFRPAVPGTYWGGEAGSDQYLDPQGGVILSGKMDEVVQYVDLEGATYGIISKGAYHVTIASNTIRNCKYGGLMLRGNFGGTIKQNTIYQDTGFFLSARISALEEVDTSNHFVGTSGYILTSDRLNEGSATLKNYGVPYLVSSSIEIDGHASPNNPYTLTVEPGVKMRLPSGSFIWAQNIGSKLIMKGTATQPIVIENAMHGESIGVYPIAGEFNDPHVIRTHSANGSEFAHIQVYGLLPNGAPIYVEPKWNADDPEPNVLIDQATVVSLPTK